MSLKLCVHQSSDYFFIILVVSTFRISMLRSIVSHVIICKCTLTFHTLNLWINHSDLTYYSFQPTNHKVQETLLHYIHVNGKEETCRGSKKPAYWWTLRTFYPKILADIFQKNGKLIKLNRKIVQVLNKKGHRPWQLLKLSKSFILVTSRAFKI